MDMETVLDTITMVRVGVLVVDGVEVVVVLEEALAPLQVQELLQGLEEQGDDRSGSNARYIPNTAKLFNQNVQLILFVNVYLCYLSHTDYKCDIPNKMPHYRKIMVTQDILVFTCLFIIKLALKMINIVVIIIKYNYIKVVSFVIKF